MKIEGIEGLADNRTPVCVVGSGPVGLSLAVDLARRGIDVLLLESGGDAPSRDIQRLSDATLVDPARHDDMAIAVARRLGGTSHLWGGRCLPYDPVDFADRAYVDARWPIGYADIAPYFPRAVEATQSGAAVYAAPAPLLPDADAAFTADTLERWVNVQSSDRVFARDIADNPHLHIRTHATLVGLRFADNGAVAAIDVAHSLRGDRVRVPVQRLVLAAGGLETTRILLAAQRDGAGRFGGRDGPLGRYYMGHVIGEIADITFDRPALSAAMDFHVDAAGSYVRRRFVASAATQIQHRLLNTAFWPVVPPVADSRHRSGILSLVYLALSNPRLGNLLVAEAIRKRHVDGSPQRLMPHLANVLTDLPQSLLFSLGFLRTRYVGKHRMPGFFVQNRAARYGLSYHAEQAPDPQSRVWLSDRTDRLGLPSLTIDLRFGAQDAQSLIDTHDRLEAWLLRNQVGRIDYRMPREARTSAILESAAHGTHQIGTARMATCRSAGVVDADLRAFDSPNLFVASSAVLPTSGQANPTLTTVALGLRLADALANEVSL